MANVFWRLLRIAFSVTIAGVVTTLLAGVSTGIFWALDADPSARFADVAHFSLGLALMSLGPGLALTSVALIALIGPLFALSRWADKTGLFSLWQVVSIAGAIGIACGLATLSVADGGTIDSAAILGGAFTMGGLLAGLIYGSTKWIG